MRPQHTSDDEEETGNEACAEREEAVSADIAANTIARLQDELLEQARVNGAGASREAALRTAIAELQRENLTLRSAAVEVCALARAWVTVWGDKLSAESIKRFAELEQQILKGAQP
jgi:hypothetical protein